MSFKRHYASTLADAKANHSPPWTRGVGDPSDGGDRATQVKVNKKGAGAAIKKFKETSPFLARTITWVLVAPLLKMENVYVATMIDNVAIASTGQELFATTVTTENRLF